MEETTSSQDEVAQTTQQPATLEFSADNLILLLNQHDLTRVSEFFNEHKSQLDEDDYTESAKIAARNNQPDLVELIFKAWKVNISLEARRYEIIGFLLDVLMEACEHSSVEVCKFIFPHLNAPYRVQHDTNFTAPIHMGIRNLEIVKMYYDKFDVNQSCHVITEDMYEIQYEIFPLSHAIETGADLNIVKYLLDRGANVDQSSGRLFYTALYTACLVRNEDIAKLLLKYGADPQLVTNTSGDKEKYFLSGILEHLKILDRKKVEFHSSLLQNHSLMDVQILFYNNI